MRKQAGGAWRAGAIGLGVSLAACSSMGGQKSASADPGARQVQMSQEQSQKALDQAREAQKRASDQAQKAAQAQQDVRDAQQKLTQAQEKARTEQQKAQQAQQEANSATQRATAEARRSQQAASQALGRQGEQVTSGQQVIEGQVVRASSEQLVLQPMGGGDPMTLRVTGDTQVRISGRESTASSIRQGEDARVAYRMSGAQPTAVTVQVMRTMQPGSSSGGSEDSPSSGQGSGSSGGQGSGSSQDTGGSERPPSPQQLHRP